MLSLQFEQHISYQRLLDRRRDVLVEPEQVGRVVASLDRPEPLPDRSWVGSSNSPMTLVPRKVHVRASVLLLQGRGKVRDPGLAYGPILGTLVKRRCVLRCLYASQNKYCFCAREQIQFTRPRVHRVEFGLVRTASQHGERHIRHTPGHVQSGALLRQGQ
jgi:hypothetical protein